MVRILVIDDEVQVRNALRLLLESHGYTVLEACNGEEGLAVCQRENTELVITDIIMDRKEGLETIIELRRDFPEIKIIAMSGGGCIDPSEYLLLAMKLGAHLTLDKPFTSKAILKAVEKLLSTNEGPSCANA